MKNLSKMNISEITEIQNKFFRYVENVINYEGIPLYFILSFGMIYLEPDLYDVIMIIKSITFCEFITLDLQTITEP